MPASAIALEMRIKRAMDLIVSLVALLLGAPVFGVIGLLVWLESGSPVIYSQIRTGLRGRDFMIYKFRTMRGGAGLRINSDGSARVAADDDRITRFGRLLREFGLDELPQLWNVLRGEMSLVGPRPYMPVHTAMLSDWARRRLEMRPGVVCLAEVSGRNMLPWPRRLELDVYYVEHWSLWLDATILLRTFPVVLFRKGVYSPSDSPQPVHHISVVPDIHSDVERRS